MGNGDSHAQMEAETESMTGRRPRFLYYAVLFQEIIGVIGVVFFVALSASLLYVMVKRGQSPAHVLPAVIFPLLVAWGLYAVLKYFFRRHLEIVVSDDGVSALALWGTWRFRFIRWTEIQRIERIRAPTTTIWNTWRNGYEFVIFGRQKDEIHFLDEITNVTVLLQLLNAYVERHHIPLMAFDRTSDTKAKIRATMMDPATRRRLFRQGQQMPLSSLTLT